MICRWPTTCDDCGETITPGQRMDRTPTGWVHTDCDGGAFREAAIREAIEHPFQGWPA